MNNSPTHHIPVLFQEVLEGLNIRPGGRYIDATVGGGGHAAGLLEASAPDGRLLGLDRDAAALEKAAARLSKFAERVDLVHTSFEQIEEVARKHNFIPVDGILLDLGLSSLQLADRRRGFAFAVDGPLDMRFDLNGGGPNAETLVNERSVEELTSILYRYGEESQARRIAQAIVAARPIRTTQALADVVSEAVGWRHRRRSIHPATLTFQALRIAVNEELDIIEATLPQVVDILKPGGRMAVISFHSLEDRIVKHFMRRESKACICPPELPVCVCDHQPQLVVITRKPIRPTEGELELNPRARSARLRVAERIRDAGD